MELNSLELLLEGVAWAVSASIVEVTTTVVVTTPESSLTPDKSWSPSDGATILACAGATLKSGASDVRGAVGAAVVDEGAGPAEDESFSLAYVEAGMKKRETLGASAGAAPSSGVALLVDCGAAGVADEDEVSVVSAPLALDEALASGVDAAVSEEVVLDDDAEGMPVAADKTSCPAGT